MYSEPVQAKAPPARDVPPLISRQKNIPFVHNQSFLTSASLCVSIQSSLKLVQSKFEEPLGVFKSGLRLSLFYISKQSKWKNMGVFLKLHQINSEQAFIPRHGFIYQTFPVPVHTIGKASKMENFANLCQENKKIPRIYNFRRKGSSHTKSNQQKISFSENKILWLIFMCPR